MSEAIEMQFDAYCKKTIKHACMDAHAELRRRAEKELPMELAYDMPAEPNRTDYGHTWLHADRFSVCIYDPELAETIRSLVPRQRNIILLCYFAEYSDRETGDILGLPVHVIRFRRQAALKKLKEILTAINYEK